MSRFGDNEEGIPWPLWEQIVGRALGGKRGQEALAQMEEALLAMPEPKLIEDNLVTAEGACAIGALVVYRRAQREGVDTATVIQAMAAERPCWCGHPPHEGPCLEKWGDRACGCEEYDPQQVGDYETADAGRAEGLGMSLAWHFGYLNDEHFYGLSPEERFERMLAWVRRAQGKQVAA